jgi:hypothetical protein
LPAGEKAGIFFTIAAIIILLFSPVVDYYRLAKTYKNPSDTLVAERAMNT